MKDFIGKTAIIHVGVEIIDHDGSDVRVKEKDTGYVYWIDKEGVQIEE